jgi:hypothetical protein
MQKLISTDISIRQVLSGPTGPSDPFAPGAREAFLDVADEQMGLAIAAGSAPEEKEMDLAKVQAESLAYGQIAALTDAFQTSSAPAVDVIMEARIDSEPTEAAERDGLAAIERVRDTGERDCAEARAAYLRAKSACDWHEANHVANVAWAPYYDRLEFRLRLAVLTEALIGAFILVSSGSIASGFETAIPAYALATYLNFKLSGYIGRASFRLRISPRRVKFRLASVIGSAGVTLVVQNSLLGLMRGGFEVSLPGLVRAVTEPMTLAPAVNMAAITLTGIGLALVGYIAFESYQKLSRGFTEEYARLRNEKEAMEAALDEAYTASIGPIDGGYNTAVAALDDAFEDEADVLAEARETSRRLAEGSRRLCRKVVSLARATEQMVDTYNQRFAAIWSAQGPVPDHYRMPARLDRDELRRHIPGASEATDVLRQIGALTTNLDALRKARGAAKAALAAARDRAAAAIRAAAFGLSVSKQSTRT